MLDNQGFITIGKQQPTELAKLIRREAKPIVRFSDEELMKLTPGSVLVFDIECYMNFFYIAFKCPLTGKVIDFELSERSTINIMKLQFILWRFLIVGFNSNAYDMMMIRLCLEGLQPVELKGWSNQIINSDMRDWQTEQLINKEFGKKLFNINHIDLIEVCPLQASLKLYGGRLHSTRMQDLPFDHMSELKDAEKDEVIYYCANDLDVTILLFVNLKDQLELRCKLSEEHGIDLRSKSDAQIAEAVIKKEVERITGFAPQKPKIEYGKKFKFIPPEHLHFQTDYMKEKFNQILNMEFEINEKGTVVLEDLKEFDLVIGKTVYRMGKGGLHSKEKIASYRATDTMRIVDRDVESYYPRMILNSGLYPETMGRVFLDVFEVIVDRRLEAKHSGDKKTADSLKITINGTFGKLGSKYSTMYAPNLLIQVTVGGQLNLLMLIEMLELHGITVVSANTDGIVSLVEKHQEEIFLNIITGWEHLTKLKTEETEYKALFSRDVNNYIAVKHDNSCKLKGTYSNPWADEKMAIFRFHKNPVHTICIEAVTKLITENIPIENTIVNCKDITKFIIVRNVKGGGEKNGIYLGKAVRWYYGAGERGAINYVASGNKVATSEGAIPLMDLPNELPNDLDYERYINIASEMLYDIGYYRRPEQIMFF